MRIDRRFIYDVVKNMFALLRLKSQSAVSAVRIRAHTHMHADTVSHTMNASMCSTTKPNQIIGSIQRRGKHNDILNRQLYQTNISVNDKNDNETLLFWITVIYHFVTATNNL